MCKTGDIIVIQNYKHDNRELSKHSFVIINDEAGQIQGFDYDLICNVMSSFKSREQKDKKLSYPGNFPITHNDSDVEDGNKKDGYIKAEQFYYFNKDEIDYVVIGRIKEEIYNKLIDFILELDIDLKHMIDNLKQKSTI